MRTSKMELDQNSSTNRKTPNQSEFGQNEAREALLFYEKIQKSPAAMILSSNFNLDASREKILKRQYHGIIEWKNEFLMLLKSARENDNVTPVEVLATVEIERKFQKKFAYIQDLSNCQYRKMLSEALELIPKSRPN